MGRMLSLHPRPRRAASPTQAPSARTSLTAPAMASPAAVPQSPVDPEASNVFRKIAFYSALATIFIRFSVLPELLFFYTSSDTYLLYLTAPVALLGCVVTGGLQRTYRSRGPILWTLFFFWMILATAFSSWIGGSAQVIASYGKTNFLLVLLMAGLPVTWKEVKAVFYTVAAAGGVNLIVTRILGQNANGRLNLSLSSGVISNSNDLAIHLILVLSFVVFVILRPRQNPFIRVVLSLVVGYGVWVILGTASRGALIGLVGIFLFMLVKLGQRQRLALLLAAPVLAALGVAIMPQSALQRVANLFKDEGSTDQREEVQESTESRRYLFEQSVRFTLERPIFGVGPGQFPNYEGKWSLAQGEHGNWHQTHCAYTQVSSENGLPALIFFMGSLLISCYQVNRVYKNARAKGNHDVASVCFCYLLAMVGYMVTMTFLAVAYQFTLPAMVGLGSAIVFASKRELAVTAPVAG